LKVRCYFFGCVDTTRAGHGLYRGSGGVPESVNRRNSGLPDFFENGIDAGLCPPGGQEQSLAWRHLVFGHTVLSMWDRTGDSRPGSNANFIVSGDHTFEAAYMVSALAFPTLMARINAAAPIRNIADLAKPERSEAPHAS
jgi:hypothetical protein